MGECAEGTGTDRKRPAPTASTIVALSAMTAAVALIYVTGTGAHEDGDLLGALLLIATIPLMVVVAAPLVVVAALSRARWAAVAAAVVLTPCAVSAGLAAENIDALPATAIAVIEVVAALAALATIGVLSTDASTSAH